MAKFVRHSRLIDTLMALGIHVDACLARGPHVPRPAAAKDSNTASLRRLAGRLAGILRGCLKIRSLYDEGAAWSHREELKPAA